MRLLLALSMVWCCSIAHGAQAYPSRPIRLVVPTGAGGVTDILARILAERVRDGLRQQVVVDNQPGAGRIIGSDIVAGGRRC